MNMNQDKEKVIGKIIHDRLPVEWMRYNMFSSNNMYKNIPILVFRLKESNKDGQMKKLEVCVESFEGKNTWKVFKDPLSRKENYLLTFAQMENFRKECYEKNVVYNEQEYF